MPRPILSPEQQKNSVEAANDYIVSLQARALEYLEIGKAWGFPDVESPELYRQEITHSVEVLAEHMRIFNLTEVTWEAAEGEHRRGKLLGWGFNFSNEEFSLGVTVQDEALPTSNYPVPFALLRSMGGISLQSGEPA